MSVNAASQGIYGISDSLYRQADGVLSGAGSTQALQDQLAGQAQDVAISNLEEQVKAGDWQAGIRTEKQLLSNGVSLAKA